MSSKQEKWHELCKDYFIYLIQNTEYNQYWSCKIKALHSKIMDLVGCNTLKREISNTHRIKFKTAFISYYLLYSAKTRKSLLSTFFSNYTVVIFKKEVSTRKATEMDLPERFWSYTKEIKHEKHYIIRKKDTYGAKDLWVRTVMLRLRCVYIYFPENLINHSHFLSFTNILRSSIKKRRI